MPDSLKPNPIGGYFGLELDMTCEYHDTAVAFNSGANALRASLLANDYTKAHIPSYTCKAVIDAVTDIGLDCSFYEINVDFEPATFPEVGPSEVFLYTNYWGLKEKYASEIAEMYDNTIIDNSQAFYSIYQDNTVSFCSCRKFFGVPDGGYLYDQDVDATGYPRDVSYECADHLLQRIDCGPEDGYASYQANEQLVAQKSVARMSRLTQSIMRSIRYDKIAKRRRSNFAYLHEHLHHKNKITIELREGVPLAYPFAVDIGEKIRTELINQRVYIPQYWPGVLTRSNSSNMAYWLTKNVIPLPIDQRYNTQDMDRVLSIVNNYT